MSSELYRDPEFLRIIDSVDLVVADGMATIYASYVLGTPLAENVGGRLLVPAIALFSALRRYRIFLLGGSDQSVVDQAADRLRQKFPGASIVGCYAPPFMDDFDESETARMPDLVNSSKPDLLFVGLGAPK